ICIFIGLPLGFSLAGRLLRRFAARHIYAIGFFGLAFVVTVLVTLHSASYAGVTAFGLLMGVSGGLYWGARHLLSLTVTRNHERDYYFGLEGSVNTLFGVVMPVVCGALIENSFFVPDMLDQDRSFLVL